MTIDPRLVRATAWISGVAVVLAAALAASRLIGLVRSEPGLPPWDAAAHALAGLDLARAIERLDPIGFLATLNRQSTWPFVHSLLLAPFFLVLGRGYATSDVASAVFYAQAVIAIFAAARALDPRRGAWVGAAAAVMALASPAFAFFGTVTMLEIAGAMLLATAFACHARACSAAEPRRWLIASGAAAAALFFCKYNYGVMWLLPLAAFEAGLHRAGERRAHLDSLSAALRGGLLRRPIPLVLLAFVAFVAVLALTGGFELIVAGQRVSVRSPGNVATALYLALAAWFLWRWVRGPAVLRERWRVLPERVRVLGAVVLVPIGIWFLVPPHLREFIGFLANRSSEGPPLWSLERLLFYPRAFATEHSPWPWLGALVLALAIAPRPPGQRSTENLRDPRTLLDLALGLGLVAALLHPFQQPRFLFTTAVLIWLRAASTAVSWLDWFTARLRARWAARAEWVWGAALASLLAILFAGGPPLEAARAARRQFVTAPRFEPVLERVLAEVASTRGPAVLLGYGNMLSPGLLAWYALQHRPDLPRQRLPRRVPWLPPDAPEEALRARIERLRATGATVISALPWAATAIESQGTREELAADRLTTELLLRRPGVEVTSDAEIPLTGWRLHAFRLTAGSNRP